MNQRTCQHCGETFASNRPNHRYCSGRCKWTHGNRTRVLKPNIRRECAVCGNPFKRYVEPSKIASGLATGEYCSLQCKGKSLSGDRHPGWKGGRCIVNGYVWKHAPNHPNAKHQGYVLEHRLVMEGSIGRLLTAEEVVHHRDGNTTNNVIENLELFASNA